MMVTRLEALADSLAHLCGANDPESEAYVLRNPILLRAFAPKHERNENGHRRFKTFVAGYENALLDLRIKCSGQSRAKLTTGSELVNLVTTYGHQQTAVRYVLKFLRKALRDESLSEHTLLGWFLSKEDTPNANNTSTSAARQ